MGLVSTSSNRYDPPCKSKPRLISLLNGLNPSYKKFDIEKYDKNKITTYINNIFSLEKYNTSRKIIFML